MKIYITLKENNYISSLTPSSTPNTIEVEVTEELYGQLVEDLPVYKYQNGSFIVAPTQEYLDGIQLSNLKQELREIQKWLNYNDYKINKFLLGEYTENDEQWITYKTERANKIFRYNELETLIYGSN